MEQIIGKNNWRQMIHNNNNQKGGPLIQENEALRLRIISQISISSLVKCSCIEI